MAVIFEIAFEQYHGLMFKNQIYGFTRLIYSYYSGLTGLKKTIFSFYSYYFATNNL